MKQTMKRLVTFCLAVAMMLSLFPAMTAKAATKTENLTLYVGEAIYVTNYYDVISIDTKNDYVTFGKGKSVTGKTYASNCRKK